MLFQLQEKSFCFDKWIVLCKTLNKYICSTVGGNFEGILGNPGKYHILDVEPLESKGLIYLKHEANLMMIWFILGFMHCNCRHPAIPVPGCLCLDDCFKCNSILEGQQLHQGHAD